MTLRLFRKKALVRCTTSIVIGRPSRARAEYRESERIMDHRSVQTLAFPRTLVRITAAPERRDKTTERSDASRIVAHLAAGRQESRRIPHDHSFARARPRNLLATTLLSGRECRERSHRAARISGRRRQRGRRPSSRPYKYRTLGAPAFVHIRLADCRCHLFTVAHHHRMYTVEFSLVFFFLTSERSPS